MHIAVCGTTGSATDKARRAIALHIKQYALILLAAGRATTQDLARPLQQPKGKFL